LKNREQNKGKNRASRDQQKQGEGKIAKNQGGDEAGRAGENEGRGTWLFRKSGVSPWKEGETATYFGEQTRRHQARKKLEESPAATANHEKRPGPVAVRPVVWKGGSKMWEEVNVQREEAIKPKRKDGGQNRTWMNRGLPTSTSSN